MRARSQWARMGARTQAEARAFFMASYRRRMGVAVVREMARHRLRRVPLIGVPRAAVVTRRQRGVGVHGVPVALSDFYAFQAYMPAAGEV